MALKTQMITRRSRRIASESERADEAGLSEFSRRKREQILKAAVATFLEYGFEGASMNVVAERAGVIKQTIYSHFKDKETLFIRAIASITVGEAAPIFTPESTAKFTPVEVLRSLGHVLSARSRDTTYAKLLRTVIGESARFPKIAQIFTTATLKPGIELLTSYLVSRPDVDLPDPEAFARVFIGTLIHHAMIQNVLYGKTLLPFDADRLIDELIRLFEAQPARRDQ